MVQSHANRGLPIDSLKGVWENLQDQSELKKCFLTFSKKNHVTCNDSENRLSARHSRAVFRVQLHRQLEGN